MSYLARNTKAALAGMTLALWAGIGLADESEVVTVSPDELHEMSARACEGGRTYTIAFSHSVSEAALVRNVRNFADMQAAELGCVTMLHDNTQNNNMEQQITSIQGWITRGVDAIVVVPIDAGALRPFQNQAQAAGIRWLTYGGEMEGSDGFVGFDHVQSGALVAQAAIDWVQENDIETPKALLTTLTSLPSVAGRWTMVQEMFAEAGIEIVAMQNSADQVSGMTVAESVLGVHPDLNIIIGFNDDSAVGALRAVSIAGIDPDNFFIAGQDGSIEGLRAVNEGGAYRASAAILINRLGENIVNLSLNAITGYGPSFVHTPTVLANRSDQELLDQLIANYGQN
ncbi:MAG: sugar ABC transporter substrate-binding protein [Pararhodobacter sp.]|nr:sugar ABC transporter substrate-binding protein [Pararhodobacter sp.]